MLLKTYFCSLIIILFCVTYAIVITSDRSEAIQKVTLDLAKKGYTDIRLIGITEVGCFAFNAIPKGRQFVDYIEVCENNS